MQHDLLAYLQTQAGNGVKDSEGEFTISQQNARQKLAKFSLPRDTAWVTKLIQGGVGWQMERILIAQSSNETQFFFQSPSPQDLPSPRTFVNALLSGKIALETPLEHFCLGLRALVEQAGLSFLLVVNDGETAAQPIYAGAYFGQMSEAQRLGKRFDRAPGITLTVRHSPTLRNGKPLSRLFKLRDFGLPIVEELRDYSFTSPVPLVHSGRNLEGFLDSPLFTYAWQVPLLQSGLNELEHSPNRLPLPPKFEEKQFSYLSHARRMRRSYHGPKEFQCCYLLESLSPERFRGAPERRSTFRWVLEGVLVHTSSLDIHSKAVGLHLFGNAEGLKTDLTGFQLVQDDRLRARKAELLRKLGEQIMRWYKELDGFFRTDTDELSDRDQSLDEDQAFRKRLKTLLKGSTAGILLTLVNAPFGVLTTLGSVASAYAPHFRMTAQSTYLAIMREAVKADLITLSQGLLRLARELETPPEEPKIEFDEIDPTDAGEVADLFKFFENDPASLVEELKRKASQHKDQPMWSLHLARAYRDNEDERAAMFFNRYLEQCPDGGVFEELGQLYEKTGRQTLAQMVRWRKDNPNQGL